MPSPTIAMIGAGNMGSSLIGGLIKNGHPKDRLWATDPSSEKLQYLKQTFGIHTAAHNPDAIEKADVIIFAIKPQVFADVARSLSQIIHSKKPLIISIAAGIRIASIQSWCGDKLAIVRAMPNTPALIGCGATGLYQNDHVTEGQRSTAESIMRSVGITVWLTQETLLDAVTALSGSGPAYFFYMMEAMQQAAVDLGLPEDSARLLTLQTALGAARMALESGKPLDDLRHHVTSPGGTTERAIAIMQEHELHEIYKKAIKAAKLHSEELAKKLGEKE